MPDITMCTNWMCKKRNHCYRFKAVPNEFWQAYSEFPLNEDGSCDWYMKLSHTKIETLELQYKELAYVVSVEDNPEISYEVLNALQNNADLIEIGGAICTVETVQKIDEKKFVIVVKNI